MKVKQLTMDEAAQLCLQANFAGWRCVEVVATIWAESRGNAYAINIVDHDPDAEAYLSLDVGLCQFNTYWHPGIPLSTSLDPPAALQVMYVLTAGGQPGPLKMWNAYKSGAYKQFLHDARVAVGI